MQNIHQVPKLRRAVDPAPDIDGFDAVTGLAGRELLTTRLGEQWEWALKNRKYISLMLVNIDHFQAFESRNSAEEVNRVLSLVGDVIADACRRRADLGGITRVGEIGVMLADCDLTGAELVANAICTIVRDLSIPDGDASEGSLTVSIGGTCRIPSPSRFQNSLVIEADRSLKQAKESGRNRCVFHQ